VYFKNGFCLGFVCPRKFERVGSFQTVDAFLKLKERSPPDALSIDVRTCQNDFKKGDHPIKPVFAGSGNNSGIGAIG
jgi:formamidopyrimidine-DNA glycosylase